MSKYDKYESGSESRRSTANRSEKPDRYDHHNYGLIRISATEYVRCTDDCCKSGGPVLFEGLEF